jgi:hypothetical protein
MRAADGAQGAARPGDFARGEWQGKGCTAAQMRAAMPRHNVLGAGAATAAATRPWCGFQVPSQEVAQETGTAASSGASRAAAWRRPRSSPAALGLSTNTHCLPVRLQWSLTRQ